MVVTLDLRGAQHQQVAVAPSPLIETMSMLHLLTERDHHQGQWSRIEQFHESLTPGPFERIQTFAPLWSRLRCRLFFPLDSSVQRTIDDELDQVAALPAARFLELAAEGVLGIGRRGNSDELITDPAEFVRACELRSSARADLARRLMDTPDEFRAELVNSVMVAWESFGRREWQKTRPLMESAAETVRLAVRKDLTAAVANLSPTTRVRSERQVSFDKLDTQTVEIRSLAHLRVIPSVRHSPHLTIKSGRDLPVSLVYPLSEGSDSLTFERVQERLDAVSSSFRMRLLRHLLAERLSTSELAMRLEVDASQVSRALTLLRRTNLVHSERFDGVLLHQADIEMLRRLGLDVLRTIMR